MTQPRSRLLRWFVLVAFAAALMAVSVRYRERWMAWLRPVAPAPVAEKKPPKPPGEVKVLQLSPQARQNLGLVSRPAKLQTYWKTILVPGEVVDRPGQSDRGVTSPAVGVVTQVHAFPGDTVRPGDRLFTLRLISEYLQNTQSELFRATREFQLLGVEQARIEKLLKTGSIAGTELFTNQQQILRQQAAIDGYRQDLLTRGLNPGQVEGVEGGKFVNSIDVFAPPALTIPSHGSESGIEKLIDGEKTILAYEVQDLKVDLGAQVQAGQLLGVLANHHSLYISGHAFKRESPYLERAAQEHWPIQMEFAEDDSSRWPTLNQVFTIRHLANSVDATSRTFQFFVPLENQSRSYEKDSQTFVVWRYQPGQRVRLHVPVDELKDVIVLPAAAIVREGPEAYVFRQNGDLFNRLSVRVLHEDRLSVVLAHDGSVSPGWYLAQSGAASLNRVLKAQAASGTPAGVHVHADGTVHGSH